MTNLLRWLRERIFGKRIQDCIGVTAGGTSPLVFDGVNDVVNFYDLKIVDGTVLVGGDFVSGATIEHIARWEGTAWGNTGLDEVKYFIDSREVSLQEFEAHGGSRVNDYSRPMTYWDLKDRQKCAYCGSRNEADAMECRKCGAPL